MTTQKEMFTNAGYTVVDEQKENRLLRFLKENYPAIIRDGEVKLDALKTAIGLPIDEKVNGYGLNFIGRNVAKAKYAQKTTKELKINETLSKNFDATRNIVLKGDNLDCLKILKSYYGGKIKCVYIDPPYNTQSDEFVYPDKFDAEEREVLGLANLGDDDVERMEFSFGNKRSHNGWLSFMYPRLTLARDLLAEDGVIFISIDDNEQANLKLVCDEIFGEDNFVNAIAVNMNSLSGVKMTHAITGKRFPAQKEYLLFYRKGIKFHPLVIEKNHKEEWDKEYNMIIPELSERQFASFDEMTDHDVNGMLSKMNLKSLVDFAKEHNINLTDEWKWSNSYRIFGTKSNTSLAKRIEKDFFSQQIVCYTNNDGNKRFFRSDYNKNVKDPRIELVQAEANASVFISDNWIDISNDGGVAQEGGVIFPNGKKPLALIKRIIKTSNIQNGVVLDFFAGSATTAHAVMELNVENETNDLKFIICQIDEPILENNPIYDFCIKNGLSPIISSITIERLRRAGEKIKKEVESVGADIIRPQNSEVPDIGFKVFDLTEAPKLTLCEEDGRIELRLCGNAPLSRIYSMIFKVGLDDPSVSPLEILRDCVYHYSGTNNYYITNATLLDEGDNNKHLSEAIRSVGVGGGGGYYICGRLDCYYQYYFTELQGERQDFVVGADTIRPQNYVIKTTGG